MGATDLVDSVDSMFVLKNVYIRVYDFYLPYHCLDMDQGVLYFQCDLQRFTAITTMNADVTTEWTLLGIKWAQLHSLWLISHPNENVFSLGVLNLCEVGLHCVYGLHQHQRSDFEAPIWQTSIACSLSDCTMSGQHESRDKKHPQITDYAVVDAVNAADEIR